MSLGFSIVCPQVARYAVFERAKGYSSSFSKIYDEVRWINAVLMLLGSGIGNISVVPADDVAYNKTYKAVNNPSSGTFPSCITDHNDTTYCSWSGGTLPYDLFYVDMGSAWSGMIRVYQYNYSLTSPYLKVYGSNDASTWTLVSTVAIASGYAEAFTYVSGYRYYKVTVDAQGYSGGWYVNIYSFEAYPSTSLPINRQFTNQGVRVVVFVYNSYYQLLEVISIG